MNSLAQYRVSYLLILYAVLVVVILAMASRVAKSETTAKQGGEQRIQKMVEDRSWKFEVRSSKFEDRRDVGGQVYH